jgi:dolichol-phosphate mannosyltransferase
MRFRRYALVSGLGMVVQLASLWALSSLAGLPVPVATALAVATAVAHNFEWHRRWTWRDRRIRGVRVCQAFAQFAAANGLTSLAGNVAISVALVQGLAMPVVRANLVAIAACGFANYVLANAVVFKHRRESVDLLTRPRPRPRPPESPLPVLR